ncbi:VanZ family protein [Actinokineospora globicatena]|uniref:VanZ family protein n=1 Tax=Actinokineospora globicatena TaxID=103729 RepID=UPI0020A50F51|nr:VanZ family protein [Actinokineospora globicatena]
MLVVAYVTLLAGSGVRLPVSLIPFADIVGGLAVAPENVVVAVAANIALFVPLGALVALISPRSRWVVPVAAGLTVSAAFEVTQYLTEGGVTSVDDLMANTLGAAAGWASARRIRRVVFSPGQRLRP